MSFDKDGTQFTLTCDNCGKKLDESFDHFYDVVDVKAENGWKSKKVNGNWEDWCDKCCEN